MNTYLSDFIVPVLVVVSSPFLTSYHLTALSEFAILKLYNFRPSPLAIQEISPMDSRTIATKLGDPVECGGGRLPPAAQQRLSLGWGGE